MKSAIRMALAASFVTAMLFFPAVVSAQWFDTEGNPIFNPGDDTNPVTPKFGYDSLTGILWINTTGLNSVVDTISGTSIGGDDVGFISMVADTPEPTEYLLTGLRGTGGNGTDWTALYFNGTLQMFALTLTEQFLMPIGTTALARYYAPDVSSSDFLGRTVELGVNFAVGPPGATMFGQFGWVLNNPAGFETCDFDADSDCNIDDLNRLLGQGPFLFGGATVTPNNFYFDLSRDGVIDNADVDVWLRHAATINGFATAYKRGDANLDGSVDVSDFNLWNGNRFTFSLNWDDGDFNGDGAVDVSDFNVWKDHKFTSSDDVTVVPEPSTVCLPAIALIGLTLTGALRRRL